MLAADLRRLQETLRLPTHRAPVIAVLDSGLDPLAALPAGTRVREVRCFVEGEDAGRDTLGWGTAAAQEYARTLAGQWGPDGYTEVELVIAKVVDARGQARPDVVARALAWVAQQGVDAIVAPWLTRNPAEPGRVVARRKPAPVRLGLAA